MVVFVRLAATLYATADAYLIFVVLPILVHKGSASVVAEPVERDACSHANHRGDWCSHFQPVGLVARTHFS